MNAPALGKLRAYLMAHSIIQRVNHEQAIKLVSTEQSNSLLVVLLTEHSKLDASHILQDVRYISHLSHICL